MILNAKVEKAGAWISFEQFDCQRCGNTAMFIVETGLLVWLIGFIFTNKKPMSIPQNLSDILSNELSRFFSTHCPATFNSKLRSLVLDFLDGKIKNDSIPPYFEDFLWTLNDFLDVLEIAATEFPQSTKS